MQGNAGYEETRLLNDAVHELTRRLPPTWDTGLTDPRHSDRTDIDAVLSIRTPGGTEVEFLVEARWSTERAPVGKVLHQLLRFADGRPAVIITDYANPTLRTQCEAAGVGYIDTTGWVCLRNDDLGLFIREQGAAKSPVPPSKRAADLTPHGPGSARITPGLEAALVDSTMLTLEGLGDGDSRAIDLRVAGPAALLTAKLIKLSERQADIDAGRGKRSRLKPKDALDCYRLLAVIPTPELVSGFESHRAGSEALTATRTGLGFFAAQRELGERGTLRTFLAQERPGDRTALAALDALSDDLLDALSRDLLSG